MQGASGRNLAPPPYYIAAPQPELEPEGQSVPLTHYLWIVRRNLWKIVVFVATCVVATAIVSSRLTPIYESTATIDIDRQSPADIVGQDSGQAPRNDTDQFLATQIKLVQSDAVLRPVVQKYDLLKPAQPEKPQDAEAARRAANAPVQLKRLKITRPPNTYLLLISFTDPNPQLAADVANAIAQSYLQHTYNIRIRSSLSLSTFMEQQMEELKSKMERSSQALNQFERQLNVINPEEKTSILSARLLQLNTEYTNAQADRVRKESIWNSVKGGSLESVQVSGQAEQLALLTQALNQANQRFAEVKTTYGSTHPEYRKAASQVTELTRQFEMMRQNIGQRVEADYNQSLGRERMLHKTVADTKSEFDHLNAGSFEYQRLKQEAEADKKLYEELVRKIKEAGINAGFQNNNIRIADTARPGSRPVFPKVQMNVLLAFFFSSLLAVGAAVLGDTLDNKVRDPEQTSRYLGTDVIGTLPAVKNFAQKLLLQTASTEAALVSTNGASGTPSEYNPKGKYRTLSGYNEAIRTLRNTILLGDFDGRLRSILVTSAGPGEGKSTTAVHLAVANAEQGKRTLIVDADLRRPSVHRKLGLTPQVGLSNILTDGIPWRETVMQLAEMPNLFIIPAGPPSHRASDLIGPKMADLLDEVGKHYDFVIVDAPPFLGFAETLQMATAADGVLVMSRAGETKRRALAGALAMLGRLRANVIGVVLNEMKHDSSDGYSYYSYYQPNYYTRAARE